MIYELVLLLDVDAPLTTHALRKREVAKKAITLQLSRDLNDFAVLHTAVLFHHPITITLSQHLKVYLFLLSASGFLLELKGRVPFFIFDLFSGVPTFVYSCICHDFTLLLFDWPSISIF